MYWVRGFLGVWFVVSTASADDRSVSETVGDGDAKTPAQEAAPGTSDGSAATLDVDLTPETPAQQASRHFKRGVVLFDDGNVQAALIEFLRSNEKAISVAALRNAALCLVRLERPDEALDKLDRAIVLPQATAAEVDEMTADKNRIEASLGTLQLRRRPDRHRRP